MIAAAVLGYMFLRGPLQPAKQVQTTTVHSVYLSQAASFLNASGYVVAQRKAQVASKATGRLVELLVEEGTVVKKGQLLARLENNDVAADLAQAKADVKVSQASLAEAEANFKRSESLLPQRLISQQDYDLTQAGYRRALAGVESAQARVRGTEVSLENTNIRAPFDGTVLTKDADVGDIVAPFGSAGNSKGSVVSMADMNSLQVEADVTEANIEQVNVGMPCEITLDAFPEKRYRGEVHMIVPTADRAKATVLVKAKFLDKDERVLPEMSAKVAFLTKQMTETEASAKPIITLDPAAVTDRNNQKVVYVIDKDAAVEKQVSLGKMVGNAVEVLSGVTTGDQVILNPPADMKTGTKVKVTE
jgi:RND family efflux transporter MFP subunit